MLNSPLPSASLVPASSLAAPLPTTEKPSQNDGLFGQMLTNALNQVAGQQAQANTLVEDHLLGHQVTDIEVLTAVKQADLTLKAMLQIRNKVVEAYNELKQIQV